MNAAKELLASVDQAQQALEMAKSKLSKQHVDLDTARDLVGDAKRALRPVHTLKRRSRPLAAVSHLLSEEYPLLEIEVTCSGLDWNRYEYSETELFRQYRFKLVLNEPDTEEQWFVGEAITTYFQGERALNERIDIIEAADSIDETTYEAAQCLFARKESVRDHLIEIGTVDNFDACLIDGMWLEPEARGKGLGATFLCRVLDWMNAHTMFAAILQPRSDAFFREREGLSMWSKARLNDPYRELALSPEGQARLVAWYERLGFQRWRDTDFWFIDLYNFQGKLPLARTLAAEHSRRS